LERLFNPVFALLNLILAYEITQGLVRILADGMPFGTAFRVCFFLLLIGAIYYQFVLKSSKKPENPIRLAILTLLVYVAPVGLGILIGLRA
jgi:hypothetical protein